MGVGSRRLNERGAEIERGVLGRQCLDQRIPELKILTSEVARLNRASRRTTGSSQLAIHNGGRSNQAQTTLSRSRSHSRSHHFKVGRPLGPVENRVPRLCELCVLLARLTQQWHSCVSQPVLRVLIGSHRHNRTDPCGRCVGIQRHERQDGIRRRVEQARHSAEDARNADLRRFRRVEIVRLRDRVFATIRVESLASHQHVLPIHLSLQHWESQATKGFVSD